MQISAGLVLVVSALWALAPIPDHPASTQLVLAAPSHEPENREPESSIVPNVFAVNLWNPPSPPPAHEVEAVVKTDPPKPLNLQLIGIIDEGAGVHYAAVYDIDNDRLLILTGGDEVRGRTVTLVTDRVVELTDGRSTQRLVLIQEPS